MSEPEIASRDALRHCILQSGHVDFVSMADVQSCIFGGSLEDLSTEQQQLVVDTVRSLLEDSLAVLGDLPSRYDPGFKPWPGTVDEVMVRFVDCFIGRHEDPDEWRYKLWLDLTAEGQQASNAIVGFEADYGPRFRE